MSYVMFDKENDIRENFQVTNSARKFGDSVKKSAQVFQCTTPQHKMKLKDTKGITNTEKRRALGDLINSHRVLGTPKASLSSKLNGTPLIKSHCMKKLTNDFERQSLSSVTVKPEPLIESPSYPPVEKCIQQVDTFTDLFEETGKISDLFIKRPTVYVPRLPVGKASDENDKLHVCETRGVNRSVKEMNKSIKNEVKKENKACLENYQDMPEFLDLPPILEDFDMSLEGEYEEL